MQFSPTDRLKSTVANLADKIPNFSAKQQLSFVKKSVQLFASVFSTKTKGEPKTHGVAKSADKIRMTVDNEKQKDQFRSVADNAKQSVKKQSVDVPDKPRTNFQNFKAKIGISPGNKAVAKAEAPALYAPVDITMNVSDRHEVVGKIMEDITAFVLSSKESGADPSQASPAEGILRLAGDNEEADNCMKNLNENPNAALNGANGKELGINEKVTVLKRLLGSLKIVQGEFKNAYLEAGDLQSGKTESEKISHLKESFKSLDPESQATLKSFFEMCDVIIANKDNKTKMGSENLAIAVGQKLIKDDGIPMQTLQAIPAFNFLMKNHKEVLG